MDTQRTTEVLVVGAGMAGLTAARALQGAGRAVWVVDKGRGFGGRVATRRIGAATFDHGAQFTTARDPRWAALLDTMAAAGAVGEWHDGPGGHPRWRGQPSMTGIAKYLARDLDVTRGVRLLSLRRRDDRWVGDMDDGGTVEASTVLLTPPVPQSLAILDAGGVELPPTVRRELEALTYDPCLCVMALLEGPSSIPAPGVLEFDEGPVAWIADNQQKGISEVPAVTLHATPAFSAEHWEQDRLEVGRMLLRAAEPHLGARALELSARHVHGWLYARPTGTAQTPCRVLHDMPPLVIAGDAFGGPRVEGAVLSGWAAADALLSRAQQS